MTEKQCRKCKETKPATEFSRHCKTKDGLQPYCKICNRQAQKDWDAKNWRRRQQRNAANYKKIYENNPDQYRAKGAVSHAIKTGKLVREPCCVCGAEPADAHHSSYHRSMWLSVTWLCREHHTLLHREAMRDD